MSGRRLRSDDNGNKRATTATTVEMKRSEEAGLLLAGRPA